MKPGQNQHVICAECTATIAKSEDFEICVICRLPVHVACAEPCESEHTCGGVACRSCTFLEWDE